MARDEDFALVDGFARLIDAEAQVLRGDQFKFLKYSSSEVCEYEQTESPKTLNQEITHRSWKSCLEHRL